MTTKGRARNDYSITYRIEYTEPIELSDFTKALNALSSEYKKFIYEEYGSESPSNAKLYIEKIEEGSILAQLVEYADLAIPFLGDVNTVYEFAGYMKRIYDFFTGDSNDKPDYDKKDLDNAAAIINPGTNHGNSTAMSVNGDNNQVMVFNLNDNDAGAAIHRILKAKKELDAPTINVHHKQAFYFEQARKDLGDKTGNYGVIESLYPSKLRVTFENERIKERMIKTNNPFTNIYIVDVELQTVREEPKVYKILDLHEIIEDDE